ncbi:ATP-binding protein [Tolumonas lignilytica]|uniref:ATP-binding protein n=1 Tax=Tolumonas lignilytica TaxID=1283284 RepID=UPI00046360A9|nr:ATP-binding protein [Tolumonas lignilytica]
MNITDIGDVINWIEQMENIHNSRSYNAPHFWKPFHFATIATKAKLLNADISIPPYQEQYAARMGLWDAIGQKPPIMVNKNPAAGRFVEARSISKTGDVHQTSIDISEMFGGGINCQLTVDSIQTLMAELLDNCCSHSTTDSQKEDTFGLVCGQAWKKANLAQICITDCGIGIRKSLLDNELLHERLRNENACSVAVEYGVTGKPGKSHSGYGLTLTNDLISHCNGHLLLVSGNEYYQNSHHGVSHGTLGCGWDGTLLIFEWNLDRPLDVTSVYNGWPTPNCLSEDEYNELFD